MTGASPVTTIHVSSRVARGNIVVASFTGVMLEIMPCSATFGKEQL
jgi:hypothetical protein